MQRKPLIGINADFRKANRNQPSFSVVTAGYYDSLARSGAIPVVLPPLDPRREKFDRMLMSLIAETRTPVFGIGVGMQLLNVTMGGNLFLHIPEDLPNAIPHKDPQDPNHRHGLEVVSDSLMGRVYGDGEIRVSSRHHMAIDEVASGFQVTARCPDGVVEAIESEMQDWIAIGTQFHPENAAASALDLRIFEEFLDLIREPVPVPAVAFKAVA